MWTIFLWASAYAHFAACNRSHKNSWPNAAAFPLRISATLKTARVPSLQTLVSLAGILHTTLDFLVLGEGQASTLSKATQDR